MITYNKLKKILLKIDNNVNIFISGHIMPDQDSVCSCLALCKFLRLNNKKAFVLLEKKDENIIDWCNAKQYIQNEVEGINNFIFVALDVNEKKRLGVFEKDFDIANLKINIDHHENNKYESNYTLTDSNMSSTCEMIYNLIKDKNLDNEICEYIYCGMLNDTRCFSRRLTNKTLSIAQQLINKKINYMGIIKKTFSNRTLYETKALAEVVNNLKFDGFYYVVIDKSKDCFKDLTHNQIVKNIAEEVRSIDNIDNLIFLIKTDNKFVAKVMTNKAENANKIAELFGGGGHKKEAGFTTDVSENEIIKRVKSFLNC